VTGGRARAAGPVAAGTAVSGNISRTARTSGCAGAAQPPRRRFEQAALALTAVVTSPAQVHQQVSVSITCRAPDLDLLLYEWLNSLVFHMATQHLLFSGFDVRIADGVLEAEARGQLVDVQRHAPRWR